LILDYFRNITFAYEYLLWLLVLVVGLLVWYILKGRNHTAKIAVSSIDRFKNAKSFRTYLRHIPFGLRLLAISCIIIALARPQTRNDEQQAEGAGIDIVLCVDVSGSMMAQDLTPNRLEAAKKVAMEFVDGRKTDRIGLVIFSGESFTQCPITTDYRVLKQQIQAVKGGFLEQGTAIGSGLSTSVDRLRNSKVKSKVVILLTDGVNNGGLIDPITAKEIAKAFRVKVYTIGVGTDGYAPVPTNTALGVVLQEEKVNIDEKLLTSIAVETGGRYFRAKDNQGLRRIYEEIDKLEKSKVQIRTLHQYSEKFFPFVFAAMLFIILEVLLTTTVFRKFP
jgi:Ca-activated chloride channel homolog